MKNKNTKFIIMVIIFLILLIGGMLLLTQCSSCSIGDNQDYTGTVSKISDDDAQKYVNDIVEESEINVNYVPTAIFSSDGKTSKQFSVKNIPNNHNPITFTILDENGNEIYSSQPIDIGYQMNEIELNEPLSRGEHECTINIGYSDSGNVRSSFPLKIVVE